MVKGGENDSKEQDSHYILSQGYLDSRPTSTPAPVHIVTGGRDRRSRRVASLRTADNQVLTQSLEEALPELLPPAPIMVLLEYISR